MYEKITGMGFNFIGSDAADQLFLLPPDPRDWLPGDHLAWEVIKVVDTLDLSGFLASYRADGQGRPAYHPKVLVALVVYCYCKGIRSSRTIEGACFDDLGARVICGNRQADHATIARFVRRHAAALKQLFVQVLAACARDGLVRVDLVAGDGTKVKVNASKATNRTVEQLDVRIEELEAALAGEVACWFEQAAAQDAAEDALFARDDPDDDRTPPAGPAARTRIADQLARAKQAKDLLAQRHGDTAGARSALQEARARAQAARARLARVTAAQQAKLDRERQRHQVKAAGGKARAGRPPRRWTRPRGCSPPATRWTRPNKRCGAPKPTRTRARCPRPTAATPPPGSCPPRPAATCRATTPRRWPTPTRSSWRSAPTTTPPMWAPAIRCCGRPAPTWTPPGHRPDRQGAV
jgi:transposase